MHLENSTAFSQNISATQDDNYFLPRLSISNTVPNDLLVLMGEVKSRHKVVNTILIHQVLRHSTESDLLNPENSANRNTLLL